MSVNVKKNNDQIGHVGLIYKCTLNKKISILESTREEQKTCKRKLFENDMTGRFVNVSNKSNNNEKIELWEI